MQTVPVVSRIGLTLLEVMVALVILGLVGAGFFEAFAGSLRATARTRDWAKALVYAEETQEAVRIGGPESVAETSLGGGFSRRIAWQPWAQGVVRATVTVILPDGGRFELDRLVATP